MAYHVAKKCFEDNVNRSPATSKPLDYNLNKGLYQAVQGLEGDMYELKAQLGRIESLLQQLPRR